MPGLLDSSGVPVVGSRSPVPTSGAGPMSQEALIKALLMARMQQQPNLGMGSLPANPLTNPRAILEAQLRQQGQ